MKFFDYRRASYEIVAFMFYAQDGHPCRDGSLMLMMGADIDLLSR